MSITFEEFFIDWQEATAPSTPNTGYVRVYAKTDGKIYRKDDTGTETELGGGGFTSFTVAGGSGTPQTISDGNTLTFTGAGGITTSAGATDTITIDGSAFVQSFTVAGNSGTNQTISNGNTLSILGSNGITTTASATDTITISGSAFIQSFTLAGGSGTPQTINNGNTLTIAGSGGITTSAGTTDTVTVDGSAFVQSFTVAGGSGTPQTISNGNTLTFTGTNGISTSAGATDTITIDGANAGRVAVLSNASMSGSSSVTISSIPSTYDHLRLIIYSRSNHTSEDFLSVQVGNGTADSSTSNYARNSISVAGTTVSGTGDNATSANLLTACSANFNSATNRYSLTVIDIPFYLMGAHKACSYTHKASIGTAAADQKFTTGGAHWLSTSTIDTIKILLGSSTFATESRYVLYGFSE